MTKFPERLKVTREIQITLEISKRDFVKVLSDHIDPDRFGLFEAFKPGMNRYKGTVNSIGFALRRKRRIFQAGTAHVRIKGEFTSSDSPTKINIRLKSWNMKTSVLYLLFLSFYIFGFSVIFDQGVFKNNVNQWLAFIALTLHMFLLCSAPVIILRKSVNRVAEMLTTDLHDLVSNYHQKSVYNKF